MPQSLSEPAPVSGSQPPRKVRNILFHITRRLRPLAWFLAASTGLIVLLGLAQRTGWLRGGGGLPAGTSERSGTVYTCPMHPQIRQPAPGRCPICGMALVPASSGVADLDEFAVRIDPARRRLANIQTAAVENTPLEASLQTVGSIAIDESRQATISAYIDGRLERLFADYTGIKVQKGDHLAVVYSPQLYAAQVDYLESRKVLDVSGTLPAVRQAQTALVTNTRQRLRESGMTDGQIAALEETGKAESRLTIFAPQGGTVVEKLAVEGNYIKAGDPIYRIAELSTVWLVLKLFPEDAARIRFGQRVEAFVQSLPGETLTGRVAFIDPVVNPETRTVGVRVELWNEDGRLRPGDYAQAQISLPIGPRGEVYDADLAGKWISPMHPQIIRDQPGQCSICGMDLVPTARYGFAGQPVPPPTSLSVPRSAVLLAGRNSVVYVETKPGMFEIRPVTTGSILRDRIVILAGLRAGESVATTGNFLIDSQMQLAGKPSLIDPTRALARSPERKGPLAVTSQEVRPIGDQAGQTLEQLFAAYFQIQKALAADQKPPAEAARTLHQAATQLSAGSMLPETSVNPVREIVAHSEHLHHLELAEARRTFRSVSQAVVTLSTLARGKDAQTEFTHFFCPMVPGGGGDWIQPDDRLLNPYFGRGMLHCGEKVRTYPLRGPLPASPSPSVPPAGRTSAATPEGDR